MIHPCFDQYSPAIEVRKGVLSSHTLLPVLVYNI